MPIDLEITICVEPTSFKGEVAERVLEQLTGAGGRQRVVGFFDPDNFTFGTPLRRAALESRIQQVVGVRAVEEMNIRPRGVDRFRRFNELELRIADNEILRLENNASRPERGVLRLVLEGGA